MKTLNADQLEFLNRYGFDTTLFESWQAGVRDRTLCPENNLLDGEILAPEAGSIHDLPKADSDDGRSTIECGQQAIRDGQFGAIILNGGMATRFGGVVKGVVEVLSGRSFLGLKLEDVRKTQEALGVRIPVYLMNSFATDEATRAHLEEHSYFGLEADQVECFTQFISVRMTPKGEVFATESGDISPYGPGHGDCTPAFRHHGCLQRFLDGGGKHLFVANVDNLGARISPLILGHHIQSGDHATVECAPKWPGDVGGAPYIVDGRLQLVEQLRFPEGFDPDIVDVFNTNTFHFAAEALDREFDLGRYYVQKKVDDAPAIQIERLIGELTRFMPSNFVRVKRTGPNSRFFPVKTPDDLEAGRDEIAEMYDRA